MEQYRVLLRNTCEFNDKIDCPPDTIFKRLCHKCGWNPDVSKERIAKLEEKRRKEKGNV